MTKKHTINVVDGTGKKNLANDSYTISANVLGYDNSTITPTSVDITNDQLIYGFTIAATGTLILHVTDDGSEDGNPIVGAIFYRCDKNGQTYNPSIVTDEDGNAVFNNVPFASLGAPKIYYRQVESDGEHDFDNTLKEITLTTNTFTKEILNTTSPERTIKITDYNYPDILIETGSIDLDA